MNKLSHLLKFINSRFICNSVIAIFTCILVISCTNNQKSEIKSNNEESAIEKSMVITNEYDDLFDNCKVEGSFLIFSEKDKTWITNDSTEIKRLTVPASTFKIVNLLIALETEVIENEKEIVKWPGNIDTLKYGVRPDTYKDMSVEDAFKMSAGWVFIELAKRIGKEQYMHYLSLCNYGNLDLSIQDDDFWNFGNFGISPINQINFLKAIHTEQLPFSKKNIDILKRVMITEENEDFVIRGKTGWSGRDIGLNIGWWVGYIESSDGNYFFASRLFQDLEFKTANFGKCRKTITNLILKSIGALP